MARIAGVRINTRSDKRFKRQIAEIEADQKGAIPVLAKLYGFTEEEATEYFNLAIQYPKLHFNVSLNYCYNKGGRYYSDHVSQLLQIIDESEIWFEKVFNSPSMEAVMSRSLDWDTIEDALRVLPENRGKRSCPAYELAGWGMLEDYVIELCKELECLRPEAGINGLKAFGGQFQDLFSEGVLVARKYLHDLIAEIIDSNAFDLPPDLLLESMVIGQFYLHGEKVHPFVELFKPYEEAYAGLVKRSDILGMIPLEGLTRLELVAFVHENTHTLSSYRKGLQHAKLLIPACPETQRSELLECLEKDPVALALFGKLKRAGLNNSDYVEFLLTYGDITCKDYGERRAIEVVEHVASQKGGLETAVLLLENMPLFLSDSRQSELVAVAESYPVSKVIFKDYFKAKAQGAESKAAVYLRLGQLIPGPSKLKELRQQLDKLDESKIVFEDSMDLRDLARCIAEAAKKEASATVQKQEKKSSLHWFDVLQYQAGSGLYKEAYNRLPEELRVRMRNIWRTQPASLGLFCEDVVEMYGTNTYDFVLRTVAFFNAYKEKLASRDLSYRVDLASIESNANCYGALTKFFHTRQQIRSGEDLVEDVEEVDTTRLTYDRVVVWGGHFDTTYKTRVAQSASVPVLFYDCLKRKQDATSLREGDAVIWLLAGSNHATYNLVKNHCRVHGLGFYISAQRGQTRMIEFIQGITTN